MRKLLFAVMALAAMAACEKQEPQGNNETNNTQTRYTARLEVAAEEHQTRLYDADLNWSWTDSDDIVGYQLAGLNLRNTLQFAVANSSFVCEAFEYMSTDPAQFHFVYPAADDYAALPWPARRGAGGCL